MKKDDNHIKELCGLFARLETEAQAEIFLQDLLTSHEITQVAERWQIVKRLVAGMPQRKISEELGISIEKVTRGAKALKSSKGGFKMFLQ